MITLAKFQQARALISDKTVLTPIVHSPVMSRQVGADIYLKLENLQRTGSFKLRGAGYKILSRQNDLAAGGVVAASAGNHAQGVALAARIANISATIVMPEWASITKQEATRSYGGDLIIAGKSVSEALEKATEVAGENRTLIHPFDDEDVILGQGTIGLEIIEAMDDVGMIIVPVGGGGLIAGIAAVAKAINPAIKVVGVQASACPAAYRSLAAGERVIADARSSIADGIVVKQLGEVNFEIIKDAVDQIVLVEEEDITSAMLMLLEKNKVIAEGAGAVPLAALLSEKVTAPASGKTVLVISGGNVDSPLLDRVIKKGLLQNGRIMRLWVMLPDSPGSLAKLLGLAASLKANVLEIRHDRNLKTAALDTSGVELQLETRGHDHVNEIAEGLKQAGYDLQWR